MAVCGANVKAGPAVSKLAWAGMLFLVVGPSGAGKDTLLALARTALAGDPRVRFVRRVITRPAGVGDEGHESVDRMAFERRRDAGGFALWWAAHELLYGIPIDIEGDLRHGRIVVASVSRTVLKDAVSAYSGRVLEVSASSDVLAERLLVRGRESARDIARRLAREVPIDPGLDAVRILNDGTPEQGAARMIAALRSGPGSNL